MTRKIAKETAASRGFTSVETWMRANRRGAAELRSQMSKRGEDRQRLDTLISCLDREHDQWRHLS